jgi:hypothetical protein
MRIFAGMVARAPCRVYRDIESLQRRMEEPMRKAEGLFEGLLVKSFGGA